MIEDRWNDEEAIWTMGLAEVRRRTHPVGVAVMDGAVLQGEAIFEARDRSPRWTEVRMTDRVTAEGEDCTVLAYRARAQAEDGRAVEALCSSTWVRQEDGWRLIQHHRAAVGRGEGRDDALGAALTAARNAAATGAAVGETGHGDADEGGLGQDPDGDDADRVAYRDAAGREDAGREVSDPGEAAKVDSDRR